VASKAFAMPAEADRAARLGVVLHVLYLVFNEGYTATSGPALHRPDLTREAVRLVRQVRRLLPDDGEVAGLLALMLITEARRPARTRPDGGLVPLAEQDRTLWDRHLLAEGIALIEATMARAPVGPYQLQAAIAACHAAAVTVEDTDWPEIAALYELLAEVMPSPVVALNRAVAVAMADGPAAGLALVDALDLPDYPLLPAVRADLLRRLGRFDEAARAYRRALELAATTAERRHLERRLAEVSSPAGPVRQEGDERT